MIKNFNTYEELYEYGKENIDDTLNMIIGNKFHTLYIDCELNPNYDFGIFYKYKDGKNNGSKIEGYYMFKYDNNGEYSTTGDTYIAPFEEYSLDYILPGYTLYGTLIRYNEYTSQKIINNNTYGFNPNITGSAPYYTQIPRYQCYGGGGGSWKDYTSKEEFYKNERTYV